MLKKIIKRFKKEKFHPTFIAVFINPFYFIRSGLLKGIIRNKKHIHGIVLDFGCGSKPYKCIFEYDKYIGLDIKTSGHPHTNSDIDVLYDGKALPFKNSYFDSVFSSEVFEHIANIDEILNEINRILKKGGRCLFTVPFVWDEHEQPYDFFRYTSFGIKQLLEKHDFKIISIEKNTCYVETIFQMWNAYLYYILHSRNNYINIISNAIFISPFTILGILLSKVLPKKYEFYHNNIVVAEKT